MNSSRSRLTIFVARWAILSGLAGTVFAVLVLTRDSMQTRSGSERNLLFASAVLLSIAFILAPVVRRAFAHGPAAVPSRKRKTWLDEMREEEGAEVPNAAPQLSSVASRLLVGLYLVFAVALVCVIFAI